MSFTLGFVAGIAFSAVALIGFLYFWEWRIELRGRRRVRDSFIREGHLWRDRSGWVYSGTNYPAVRDVLPKRTRYEGK